MTLVFPMQSLIFLFCECLLLELLDGTTLELKRQLWVDFSLSLYEAKCCFQYLRARMAKLLEMDDLETITAVY